MSRVCFFHLKAHAAFEETSGAPIGGTLVQMRIVAEKLSQDPRRDVFFLVGNFGQPQEERYGRIRLIGSTRMNRTIFNLLSAPFSIWRDFKRIDADTFIASSAGPETGILRFLCFLSGKRMVYRIAHEWDCTGEYAKKRFLSGRLFAWGMKRADVVVSQSDDQKALLWKHQKITSTVIRNSFVLPPSVLEVSGIPKKSILWVSRCEPWKHPELFLKLARLFPRESFVMVCPKQRYGETFFRSIKEEADRMSNVRFFDFIPFSESQLFFNEAKVFVATSEYEGFPNTYIQACIGGTPIVSYRVNPDGMLDKHGVGFCADGSWEKVSRSLETLISDDGTWRKCSQNAVKYVRDFHDIEKNVHEWLKIL